MPTEHHWLPLSSPVQAKIIKSCVNNQSNIHKIFYSILFYINIIYSFFPSFHPIPGSCLAVQQGSEQLRHSAVKSFLLMPGLQRAASGTSGGSHPVLCSRNCPFDQLRLQCIKQLRGHNHSPRGSDGQGSGVSSRSWQSLGHRSRETAPPPLCPSPNPWRAPPSCRQGFGWSRTPGMQLDSAGPALAAHWSTAGLRC